MRCKTCQTIPYHERPTEKFWHDFQGRYLPIRTYTKGGQGPNHTFDYHPAQHIPREAESQSQMRGGAGDRPISAYLAYEGEGKPRRGNFHDQRAKT